MFFNDIEIDSIDKYFKKIDPDNIYSNIKEIFNKYQDKNNVYYLKCIPNNAKITEKEYDEFIKEEINRLEEFISRRFMKFINDSKTKSYEEVTKPFSKIVLMCDDNKIFIN